MRPYGRRNGMSERHSDTGAEMFADRKDCAMFYKGKISIRWSVDMQSTDEKYYER